MVCCGLAKRRQSLTPRAADTASPWARRGGWLGKVGWPAVAVDGAAVPLTPSLGSKAVVLEG